MISAKPETTRSALRGRYHFSVEVRDHLFEGRDRLLNRGDLHQFPAADRTASILQRDHQISALLLELNKRQTMVRQISRHDVSRSSDWTIANPSRKVREIGLPNFSQIELIV